MLNPSKWLLIGVLIILAIGIIGIGFYTSQRLGLIENNLRKETNELREEIKKLRKNIEQIKEKVSEIDVSNWNMSEKELKKLHPWTI